MPCRRATHAGSWYSSSRNRLDTELNNWLADVNAAQGNSNFTPPIKGCKAIIAPHAGYAYSGPTAAWAYKSIDTAGIKRVFVLGPSHHVYMDGCALPTLTEYATPIGNLPLDLQTIAQLRATGHFIDMSIETDEDEHSIEMHLPYIRKIFQGQDISLVPILVGGISKDKETFFGKILAPYLAKQDTVCIVSSDFCHWGTRFQYTYYYTSPPNPNTTPDLADHEPAPSVRLSRSQAPPSSIATFPIHGSIEALDREALKILTLDGGSPESTRSGGAIETSSSSLVGGTGSAEECHNAFSRYLLRTKNTICGRHPIGVLLGALVSLEKEEGEEGNADDNEEEEGRKTIVMKWIRYAQSSKCFNINDSSVSYASGYVRF